MTKLITEHMCESLLDQDTEAEYYETLVKLGRYKSNWFRL